MMWWWGDGRMGAMGWIGMVFMIIFWIAVIVGLVLLFRYLFSRTGGPWREQPPGGPRGLDRPHGPYGPWPGAEVSSALRILEERYARGEIDREEFLQRRADLERRTG